MTIPPLHCSSFLATWLQGLPLSLNWSSTARTPGIGCVERVNNTRRSDAMGPISRNHAVLGLVCRLQQHVLLRSLRSHRSSKEKFFLYLRANLVDHCNKLPNHNLVLCESLTKQVCNCRALTNVSTTAVPYPYTSGLQSGVHVLPGNAQKHVKLKKKNNILFVINTG